MVPSHPLSARPSTVSLTHPCTITNPKHSFESSHEPEASPDVRQNSRFFSLKVPFRSNVRVFIISGDAQARHVVRYRLQYVPGSALHLSFFAHILAPWLKPAGVSMPRVSRAYPKSYIPLFLDRLPQGTNKSHTTLDGCLNAGD